MRNMTTYRLTCSPKVGGDIENKQSKVIFQLNKQQNGQNKGVPIVHKKYMDGWVMLLIYEV